MGTSKMCSKWRWSVGFGDPVNGHTGLMKEH